MRSALILAATQLLLAVATHTLADDNWPQFRGPSASGVGGGNPPLTWDVETEENIAWSVPVAGLAHSSPVVWGDRVFLTTAVNSTTERPALQTGWLGGTGDPAADEGEWSWQVLCLDLATGKPHWQREAASGRPTIKRHLKSTHANPTPATDGEHIIACFGSEGVYCYDFDGELRWSRRFGRLHSGPFDAPELEWGFGSSVVLHDGFVILQCDCLNTAFVAILDIETGEEIRRIERDDVATWSTPLVVGTGDRTQIVCNGFRQMAGYDLRTGDQLWTLRDGGDVPVPSPVFTGELFLITNGHGRSPVYAVSPDARGDITPDLDSATVPDGLEWWQPQDGAYMPTPIVVGENVYTCNDNGRLVVRRASTGELVYRQRLGSGGRTFTASAVATTDRLYFTDETGNVTVVRAGDEFEQLARNRMDCVVLATPALAGDRLLIRSSERLYCISRTEEADDADAQAMSPD